MQALLVIIGATLSPMLGLALLLWLAHLEDTLPRDVARSGRTPAPPPILAIPVTRAPASTLSIPAQRRATDAETVVEEPVPAV